MKIVLDNGHGKETAGKRSPVWSDGSQLFEWEFNRNIARRIQEALHRLGEPCALLVPEQTDISLAERVRRANKMHNEYRDEGGIVLISIHANAGGGTGWEAFTSKGKTKSDGYATMLYEEMQKAFPNIRMRTDTTDGDSDKEDNFYILKNTTCPAILTENLFMDYEPDYRILMSEDGRQRIADAHVRAILRILESA